MVNFGDSLTLGASSAPNSSSFGGWSGACTNSTGPCNLTNITANQTVTATFNLTPQFTLTVDKINTSATVVSVTCCGTVTSTPPGISCGPICPDQTAHFDTGTRVTLTATADSGSSFSGWTGDCSSTPTPSTCVVSMTQPHSVKATFSFVGFFGSGTSAPFSALSYQPSSVLSVLATGTNVVLY